MMLKSKLAAFAGALILAGSAFAGQTSLCPNINDIKAEGIYMAEEIEFDMYITYNISNYNTRSIWGFLIAPVQAESAELAIEDANRILSTMSAQGVPEQHGDAIICDYDTGRQDVIAVAINDAQQITPMKLKYFFKKAH
ncbi:DUF4949 domain-containing protein [Legionella worsleiensis]|uniref:Hemin binding protein Hbp n=1 Tax=Legionella worsleiensis TaxID=45076 RepID=A0A0W1AKX1_9GAMM|nr:DUF4949 domain-containing protein [Legionella worsleiensis]KTD81969.1 hemin binding protein Hbp [Legionella worsleiensis]STY31349.1 hemin binding protein Hbp [Legionella worsleiensis]